MLTYRRAVQTDAGLLVDIMDSSFYDDYVRYGECPGYGKTEDQMKLSILKFSKYIIEKDRIPVGVISFENKGDGQYYLGCLCVIPAYQGTGIGTQAVRYMLSVCRDWKRVTLITPSGNARNIKFYTEKCGFSIGGKMMDGNVEVTEFILER